MLGRRLGPGLGTALALAALVALAPAVLADEHEPPVEAVDIEGTPAFENATADTDELAVAVTLARTDDAFNGSYRVNLAIANETVAVVEDEWPADADEVTVHTDEDADEGPGTWSPRVGLHPFNLTVEAEGGTHRADLKLPMGPDLAARPAGEAAQPLRTVPEDPEAGDAVAFEVDVANEGTWATPEGTEVPVRVFVDGERVAEATVQALAADEATTVTLEDAWTAEAGFHRIAAEVDPAAVEEIRANNNDHEVRASVPADRLAVGSLDVSPDPAPADATVTVNATLENDEEEPREASRTDLYVDGEAVAQADTPALDPGEQATHTFVLEPEPGLHRIGVLPNADAAAGSPLAVHELAVGPDPVLADVTASPNPAPADATVTLEAVVENRGTALPDPIPVQASALDDETVSAEAELDGLDAGEQAKVTLELTPPPGEHRVVVAVAAGPNASDARPVNNKDLVTLEVTPPERLAVASLGVAEGPPSKGEPAPAVATLVNRGNGTLEGLQARFAVDGEPLGDPVNLSAIEPGDTAFVEGPDWTPSPGEHVVELRVGAPGDLEAGAPLARETTTLHVAGEGPHLAVVDVGVDRVEDRTASLTVTVANPGDATTPEAEVTLRVDGVEAATVEVPELPAGEELQLPAHPWTFEGDTAEVEAVVDAPGDALVTDEAGRPLEDRTLTRTVDLEAASEANGTLQGEKTDPVQGPGTQTPGPSVAALVAAFAAAGLAVRRG